MKKAINQKIKKSKILSNFLVFSCFIVFLISCFVVAPDVFAEQTVPETGYTTGIIPSGLSADCYAKGKCGFCDAVGLIDSAIKWILGLTGSLALLAFVWGGVNIMMSKSGIEYFSKGKKIITSALIGLVLIFGSYVIVNMLLNILIGGAIGSSEENEQSNQGQVATIFGNNWANICENYKVGPESILTPEPAAETPAVTAEERDAALDQITGGTDTYINSKSLINATVNDNESDYPLIGKLGGFFTNNSFNISGTTILDIDPTDNSRIVTWDIGLEPLSGNYLEVRTTSTNNNVITYKFNTDDGSLIP